MNEYMLVTHTADHQFPRQSGQRLEDEERGAFVALARFGTHQRPPLPRQGTPDPEPRAVRVRAQLGGLAREHVAVREELQRQLA